MRRMSPEVVRGADDIVRNVAEGGDVALLALREKHDTIAPTKPLIYDHNALVDAREGLTERQRSLLERTAERILRFAKSQRDCLQDLNTQVDGGRAGHTFAAVDSAGCYAPGGRYPLVSSVLMTAVTARAAGVANVCVASPSDLPIMRAAAAIAGANSFLHCGGAHAIAALAHGTETVAPVHVIVGPGNDWVTAAKQRVSGAVGIDMLAGPSELVVIADETARPEVVAADLLAQAEHDPDARVVLLTTCPTLAEAVRAAATEQLASLPTRAVAQASWSHATWLTFDDEDQLIDACNRLAPEHLHLNMPSSKARILATRLRHYGALFIGEATAEVLGDYGAGPNHVLPTDGSSRFSGGLSVLTFLRMRTWLEMTEGDASVTNDACDLANLEGLSAHERSAALRH